MYGLPHTTEIRKQLPKKAIYAKFELKPAQRDGFDADVSRIDIVAVFHRRRCRLLLLERVSKSFMYWQFN